MAKAKQIIWNVFKYFTLILGAFVSVLPVIVCVITAFKTPEEYQSTNVMTMPQSWTYFENFTQAWKQANMGVAFRNSMIILVFVLIGSVLTGSMIAYILSRFKFKGNGLLRAADAAVAAMPALTLVCFDDVRRLVVFLVQFQNVAGAILHAAATLDAFLGIKNRRHVVSPCERCGITPSSRTGTRRPCG